MLTSPASTSVLGSNRGRWSHRRIAQSRVRSKLYGDGVVVKEYNGRGEGLSLILVAVLCSVPTSFFFWRAKGTIFSCISCKWSSNPHCTGENWLGKEITTGALCWMISLDWQRWFSSRNIPKADCTKPWNAPRWEDGVRGLRRVFVIAVTLHCVACRHCCCLTKSLRHNLASIPWVWICFYFFTLIFVLDVISLFQLTKYFLLFLLL